MSGRSRASSVLALLLAALALTGAGRADRSLYKGYSAVNGILQDRLLAPGADFQLGRYLGEEYHRQQESLTDLLGTYKGYAADSRFRNGQPNVVSLLLWYVAMSALGDEISRACEAQPGRERVQGQLLHPSFARSLRALCAWPAASARDETALLDLWTALSGFDAPREEFEAWRGFALSAALARAPAREAVQALVTAALLNPHFLLR